ncbi:MAG: hypothetical protein ACOCPY_01835, partial [Halorubrum sp.]
MDRRDTDSPPGPDTPNGAESTSGPDTPQRPESKPGPDSSNGAESPSGPDTPKGPESPSGPDTPQGPESTSISGRVEWLLVVALLAVPMAIIPGGDDAPTIVSLWGFVPLGDDGGALGGYPVWAYFLDLSRPFATLPPSIRAWPLAL